MNKIESFINFLLHQKRYSKNTVVAYQKDIEQLFDFSSKTYQVSSSNEITSNIIRSWLADLKDTGNSNRTIIRKISSIKTFFKYLKKNDFVAHNPLTKIVTPKTDKPLPSFLKTEETTNLFNTELFPDNYIGKRDCLILEIFYATGMRLSELTSLTIESINLNSNHIKVIGKRNKERLIPITLSLKQKITEYLNYRKELPETTNYLFLTDKGKKIYTKLVYRIVFSYLSTVTNNNKKSPHILRHTFATHMLNNGADLNTIKEILGHSNLSATQVYTHNTIEKLKNIHKQAHPKA
ncbi:MAG: tyrosine-type recombinase/integrase [Flavobacteriales bacterium]|nr:tyrosine-type recombinase/integrase [Flavobacteriales bacterium]